MSSIGCVYEINYKFIVRNVESYYETISHIIFIRFFFIARQSTMYMFLIMAMQPTSHTILIVRKLSF